MANQLDHVGRHRQRAITEGEQIFEQAISEATGQNKTERLAEIDRVVDAFRDRHYKLVRVDGKAVPA